MTFEKVDKPVGYDHDKEKKPEGPPAGSILENGEKKNGLDPMRTDVERVVDSNVDIKIEEAS